MGAVVAGANVSGREGLGDDRAVEEGDTTVELPMGVRMELPASSAREEGCRMSVG